MSPNYAPTSVHLSGMLDQVKNAHVSVSWLIERLGERSFGLTLFLMALIALVPGASTVVGVLIAWPAIQMVLGHRAPLLPDIIARRHIEVGKLAHAIRILLPRIQWFERLIRPR